MMGWFGTVDAPRDVFECLSAEYGRSEGAQRRHYLRIDSASVTVADSERFGNELELAIVIPRPSKTAPDVEIIGRAFSKVTVPVSKTDVKLIAKRAKVFRGCDEYSNGHEVACDVTLVAKPRTSCSEIPAIIDKVIRRSRARTVAFLHALGRGEANEFAKFRAGRTKK